MSFSLFRGGLMRSASGGGISLPVFGEPVGGALQHLFASSEPLPYVSEDDGYTYVHDAANKGDARDIRAGSARAYSINGVTTIAHSDSLTFGNGTVDQPFSISAWVNMTDATTFELISKGTLSFEEYYIRANGSDLITFYLISSVGNVNDRIGLKTTALTAYEGQDLFIVATYDGGGLVSGMSLSIYNTSGTLLLSGADDSLGTYTAMNGTSAPLSIGSEVRFATYANGSIWDVRVHNTELTTTEIENLVANPTYLTDHEVGHWQNSEEAGTTAFDSSGNGLHGTDTGGVTHVNQSTVFFANTYGFIESDGASYYLNDDDTGLIPVGVIIPAKLT